MSETILEPPQPGRLHRAAAFLNYLSLLAVMTAVAGILLAAMVMQYVYGEIPCPLCLLQRVGLFGVGFAAMQNFRRGFSHQNSGLALLFSALLLVVAIRQTLLDIYPRPGHEYIGSAVLGLHMPVWSILIALALIVGYALRLFVLGADPRLAAVPPTAFPALRTIGYALAYVLLALAAVNAVSVLLQCGFSECHTTGYRLLGGLPKT